MNFIKNITIFSLLAIITTAPGIAKTITPEELAADKTPPPPMPSIEQITADANRLPITAPSAKWPKRAERIILSKEEFKRYNVIVSVPNDKHPVPPGQQAALKHLMSTPHDKLTPNELENLNYYLKYHPLDGHVVHYFDVNTIVGNEDLRLKRMRYAELHKLNVDPWGNQVDKNGNLINMDAINAQGKVTGGKGLADVNNPDANDKLYGNSGSTVIMVKPKHK